MAIAACIVVAMVSVATASLLPLLTATLLAAFAMIFTRCMTAANAANAVSIPVIMTIALSFGVSKGLEVMFPDQNFGDAGGSRSWASLSHCIQTSFRAHASHVSSSLSSFR